MYYQRTPEQIKKKLKTKQRYHGQKEQWKALMFQKIREYCNNYKEYKNIYILKEQKNEQKLG